MNPKKELKARELFFEYDGSRFYMSRDGVEDTYLRYRVPKKIEAIWLEELTTQRLRELNMTGNWRVVYFLNNHGDYRHIEAVLSASPKGSLSECCAFLEELLKYLKNSIEQGIIPAPAARSALDTAILHSIALRRRVRTNDFRHRIDDIIQEAKSMINEQGHASGHGCALTNASISPAMRLLLSCCCMTLPGLQKPDPGKIIREGVNWQTFLGLVDYHQVSPLVYVNLQKTGTTGVPPGVQGHLKNRYKKRRLHALRLMSEAVRLVNACRTEGIEIICLKGPVLALQLYGDIAMRHIMDIDFLVDYRDLKKIHPLLLHFGYETKHPELFSSSLHWQVFTHSKHHIPYFHPKELLQLELHFRLFKNRHVLPNSALNAWANPQTVIYAGTSLHTLNTIDNTIYLFVHGAIHQWCLLKWLTDLAQVGLSPMLDWEILFSRARELGLERPVLQGLLLLNHLFDIPLPLSFSPSPPPKPVIKMTQHALKVINQSNKTAKRGFLSAARERFYLLKLKKGFRYKLRYLRDLFYLDSHRDILRLPGFLYPLYILLNPFLWLYKNYLMKKKPRQPQPPRGKASHKG